MMEAKNAAMENAKNRQLEHKSMWSISRRVIPILCEECERMLSEMVREVKILGASHFMGIW